MKEARELVNKAPPAAGLLMKKLETEPIAKVEPKVVKPEIVKKAEEVKKNEGKAEEVKKPVV